MWALRKIMAGTDARLSDIASKSWLRPFRPGTSTKPSTSKGEVRQTKDNHIGCGQDVVVVDRVFVRPSTNHRRIVCPQSSSPSDLGSDGVF
jgi:hypothetical protein